MGSIMPVSFGLMLYCDPARAEFALAKAGVAWRQCFPSMEEALNFASLMIIEETPITIVDKAADTVRHMTARPRG